MKINISTQANESIRNYIKSKHFRNLAIALLSIITLFLVTKILFFLHTSVKGYIDIILSPYLSLVADLAYWILKIIHHPIKIENFKVITDSGFHFQLTSGFLSKTWTLIAFSFIFFIPSDRKKIIVFSSIALLMNFLLNVFQLVITSLLISETINKTDAKNIGYTLIAAGFFLFIVYWLKVNKIDGNRLFPNQSEEKMSKAKQLILLFLGAILFKNIVISIFNFGALNHLLLRITVYLVSFSPYDVLQKGQTLYGMNGNLYLAKYCLGLQAMFIFSAFVWLTGNNISRKLIFIVSGILFINITNIIRLTLLYTHIQKWGNYQLAIDLHEMFNIIIYTLIFILWVIWIEKLSDLWISPVRNKKTVT